MCTTTKYCIFVPSLLTPLTLTLPLHSPCSITLSQSLCINHETIPDPYSFRCFVPVAVKSRARGAMLPKWSGACPLFATTTNPLVFIRLHITPRTNVIASSACTNSLSFNTICLFLIAQTRFRSRTRSFRMSPPLNNVADPVERTASPYPNPYEVGPKSKILSSRTSNYHSTSLRNMVTVNTVNKTALHPGGVQYVPPSEVTFRRP
jgi:hypothetical protein